MWFFSFIFTFVIFKSQVHLLCGEWMDSEALRRQADRPKGKRCRQKAAWEASAESSTAEGHQASLTCWRWKVMKGRNQRESPVLKLDKDNRCHRKSRERSGEKHPMVKQREHWLQTRPLLTESPSPRSGVPPSMSPLTLVTSQSHYLQVP